MRSPRGNVASPRRRSRFRNERGVATLEIAILFPLVLLITFGVIEGALWYYARNVALAAAEEGVRVASADKGSLSAGIAKATDFATRAGSDGFFTLSGTPIAAGDTETVIITVKGQSMSLIGGWSHEVSATASAPIERFTSPN
jgi:Flp pilus assembly protein TadG